MAGALWVVQCEDSKDLTASRIFLSSALRLHVETEDPGWTCRRSGPLWRRTDDSFPLRLPRSNSPSLIQQDRVLPEWPQVKSAKITLLSLLHLRTQIHNQADYWVVQCPVPWREIPHTNIGDDQLKIFANESSILFPLWSAAQPILQCIKATALPPSL